MTQLLTTVGNSSEISIYAMDETYVRLESQNRRSWSLKGVSPILERNNPHIGVNIVGASKIHGTFETYADVYDSKHSITNQEVRDFLDYLLTQDKSKKIYIIMDNARSHNCEKMSKYAENNRDRLVFINLPAYSPDLNPQENLWNLLKNTLFSNRARSDISELFEDIKNIYEKLNENKSLESSVTCAKNYYA